MALPLAGRLVQIGPRPDAAMSAAHQLLRNLAIYGLGGVIAPFIGIKLVDLAIVGLGLSPREFDLLWTLADKPGRVVRHERLQETVWGPAHRHDPNHLRVAVRALRRKLEVDPATPRRIVNEPGVGYRLAGGR